MMVAVFAVSASLRPAWPQSARLGVEVLVGAASYAGILVTMHRQRSIALTRAVRSVRPGAPPTA